MGVLNEPVLVLNRNWQAVTFLPVQTSIVTAMRDMACVLDAEHYLLLSFEEWIDAHQPEFDRSGNPISEDGRRWIKTPSLWIPAPEVIVLKQYGERPPRKVTFNRNNLARRDEYLCQYCGKEIGVIKMTIDHVLPRSRGGTNSWENCVAACKDCNSRKADMTPKEARMSLRKQPVTPTWSSNHLVPSESKMRPAWRPFLSKAV